MGWKIMYRVCVPSRLNEGRACVRVPLMKCLCERMRQCVAWLVVVVGGEKRWKAYGERRRGWVREGGVKIELMRKREDQA